MAKVPLRIKSHIHTPLLLSAPLSKFLSKPVYLKMDALQPSGSYKDRGMGQLLSWYADSGVKTFISSSGGNAGISAATVANNMNLECTVVVPTTTSPVSINKMKLQNAKVIIHGKNWNEADVYARELLSKTPNSAYVHPFNHPLLWKGHSTVIEEISDDIKNIYNNNINQPDVIVCSVGGGGLLNGICIGLDKLGWNKTHIITSETIGCDSFYQSKNIDKIIELPEITSIATTLGAKSVVPETLTYTKNRNCFPQIVHDSETVYSCKEFLNDHRILVEPACAASLALLYYKKYHHIFDNYNNIFVQICGGNGVNLEILEKYCKQFNIH